MSSLAPSEPRPKVNRQCPRCGDAVGLHAIRVLYPMCSDEEADVFVVVCWTCNTFRRALKKWEPIDLGRHKRDWRVHNKRGRAHDRQHR